MKEVEIVPYQTSWEEDFRNEKTSIKKILPEKVNVYHIGSTAIPNMFALPIIDLMIEVENINKFDQYSDALCTLGYEAMGEQCVEDRRFFKKCNDKCSFHIHIFAKGNPEIERHIAFREFMIAHKEQAFEYIKLKKELAKKHPQNKEEYKIGREVFLDEIDKKASNWKK